ncbi:methylated-DNA--[protein]-cysteine S-methyltransferase [Skermanella rosea]|uniref:methylated-DNA--[protein]-cysteine S-methyltransferase n=1 Tax=Skermanella rosea TaxID=1817965 RepID=UPI0019313EF1|nr:methylated-DNA--[protein]-cysteine S-methyltransferase [Skermanella rosea]UEM03803.1 methylated-DNA--[protein]-cysteine S-methyltransferase [Skermanella rosea]
MTFADPMEDQDLRSHYAAIAAAIDRIVDGYQDQPSLEDMAAAANMSPFHFQRVFKRWAGISPKRFAQFVTLGHAKRLLDEDGSVLDTALEVGLSGPSRLHDLFVACEAMTPGDYKAGAASLTVRWGLHDSPFGRALMAATPRGLCWLSFVIDGDERAAVATFREEWGEAALVEDPAATAGIVDRVFGGEAAGEAIPLVLRGTNFQIKVWEALLRIPAGRFVSYQDLARAVGRPEAPRAVGAAVGRNPISLIIPCHRVILKSGVVHNYRWGVRRKKALLAYEAARAAG